MARRKPTNLQIQRMSGNPVIQSEYDAYKLEFQTRYDLLAAEAGLDMEKLHKGLIALDEELLPKYKRSETIEMPKSALGWRKLIKRFDCPLMVAPMAADPRILLLVLMDQPLV